MCVVEVYHSGPFGLSRNDHWVSYDVVISAQKLHASIDHAI